MDKNSVLELSKMLQKRTEEDRALMKEASDQALQRFSELLEEFSREAIEAFRVRLESQLDDLVKTYREDCVLRAKQARDERQS